MKKVFNRCKENGYNKKGKIKRKQAKKNLNVKEMSEKSIHEIGSKVCKVTGND